MKKLINLLVMMFVVQPEPTERKKPSELLSMIDISNDHLIIQPTTQPSKKDYVFENVSREEPIKKLGLVHNPKVHTIESTATFNQRSYAIRRQMKKGLKRLPKVQLAS